jgi:very-short-patch-repair endonuclease
MKGNSSLKCCKCGLIFNKNGYYKHVTSCHVPENDVNEIINKYVINLYSINDLYKEYGVSKSLISKMLGEKVRKTNEASVIGHKKHPESYITSYETKNKLRFARLKYMKEHPEQTAWRLKNMSYPEKIFKNALELKGFNKTYLIVREFSVFPYFIDFAFVNEKLAVEIDGSQHLAEDRHFSDIKKDKILNENEWTVYRATANQVKFSINEVLNEITDILKNKYTKKTVLQCGIVEYLSKSKINKKLKENERLKNNGYTIKQIESHLKQRKIERPDYITLCDNIEKLGYSATGRKYGVSDNTIRKWRKNYENDFSK